MAISAGSIVFDAANNEVEVRDFIGQGGFGQVYKCGRKGKNDLLALKTLPALLSDQQTIASFKNEAQLAVGIEHPNVIKYEFFHDGSTYPTLPPYILMEYADGGSLANLLEEYRPKGEIAPDTLISLVNELINGMEAVNSRLVHRDIKPDNIVFVGGHPKITDFGLSKIVQQATRTTTFKGFGTARYMAPEGWTSEANTIQMDIYSMGLVFYELATLRYPYSVKNADRPNEWMDAHLFQTIPRPETLNRNLSITLAQVITKMLEKQTTKRFADWAAIRHALASEKTHAIGEDAPVIEAALKRRMEADAAQRESEAQSQKAKTERELFLKTVSAQFENEIIRPLETFISELNAKYVGQKAVLSAGTGNRYQVRMPSGSSLDIRIEPILRENFVREVTLQDPFGKRYRRQKTMMPHLQNNELMAWGYISGADGRGYNLLLLKSKTEIYGTWRMLENKMGWPSNVTRRPEPFAFSLEELEEEIRNVGAMHVYSIRPIDLDLAKLKAFVAQYF